MVEGEEGIRQGVGWAIRSGVPDGDHRGGCRPCLFREEEGSGVSGKAGVGKRRAVFKEAWRWGRMGSSCGG